MDNIGVESKSLNTIPIIPRKDLSSVIPVLFSFSMKAMIRIVLLNNVKPTPHPGYPILPSYTWLGVGYMSHLCLSQSKLEKPITRKVCTSIEERKKPPKLKSFTD